MTHLDLPPRSDSVSTNPADALRESEARFAVIFNASPYAISLTSMPDGTLVDVNEAFLKLFELGRDEAVGRTSVDLGIADAASRARVAAELEHKGRVRGFEVTRTTRRGAQRTLLLDIDRVRIASHSYVLTTVQDITARKEAENALAQREAEATAIFEALTEGVAVLDRDGTELRFNPAVTRILGGRTPQAGEAVRPRHVAMLRRPDGSPISPDDLPGRIAVRTGLPVRDVEFTIPLEDGEVRWVSVNAQPIRDGTGAITGAVSSVFDITSLKETEARLRDGDHRKNELIAALSHELRNPLLPIRTSVDVLRRAPPGSDAAYRALSIIERQGTQLERMVDDLLDVATMSHGRVTLERQPLELAELVAHVVEDHKAAFERAGLRLTVELGGAPAWVNGDGARLRQALSNVLGNAAKFTARGGRVDVELATGSGEARVTVRDTGLGIDPSQLKAIFEPFAQGAQPIDRKAGGLGLGLSVARGLVSLHGGRIEARSDGAGAGATFLITLPLCEAPPEEQPEAPAEAPERLRVLVIEDNEDAAESLQMALEFEGHEVAVARSGHEGVERARALTPQVVFCDIGLPGMNGYEVARALRGDERLRTVHLVALTGYTRPEDVARATDSGFDLHVAKPVSLDDIVRVLRQVMSVPA